MVVVIIGLLVVVVVGNAVKPLLTFGGALNGLMLFLGWCCCWFRFVVPAENAGDFGRTNAPASLIGANADFASAVFEVIGGKSSILGAAAAFSGGDSSDWAS